MSTTPKMIRIGARSSDILDALKKQLRDQYTTEGAVLNEAARRGLLLMAVEAYRDETGQYGGHSAKELARILRHELTGLFNFLMEHDELPAMLRVPPVVVAPAPASTGAMIAVETMVPEPPAAVVTIDAAVIESVQLGGQDEDWD